MGFEICAWYLVDVSELLLLKPSSFLTTPRCQDGGKDLVWRRGRIWTNGRCPQCVEKDGDPGWMQNVEYCLPQGEIQTLAVAYGGSMTLELYSLVLWWPPDWIEGREGRNVDPRARSAFTQRSAIQTWGKLGCRNAFGLPWAVTRRRVIWCQTNFTRSQLFAINMLRRQQACRYSMLRCIKHWQDVRNHGCGALGVDHSLSNKLSRLI